MEIDKELKDLVFFSVKCLGDNIKTIYGEKIFQKVEKLRIEFKSTRDRSDEYLLNKLLEQEKVIKNYTSEELALIAKSFTLMLELINCCEMAFRKKKLSGKNFSLDKTKQKIIFVLTSHPTEARSEDFLEITERLIKVLEKIIISKESHVDELNYLLCLALSSNITKEEKPSVKDEANQIYHAVVRPDIIKKQIELYQKGVDFSFRAWPGGDKDGHPGVGPVQMVKSLNLSRKRITSYLNEELSELIGDLLVANGLKVANKLKKIQNELRSINMIKSGDGERVAKIRNKFLNLESEISPTFFLEKYNNIKTLFWLYPALVVPLELREDSQELKEALQDINVKISEMLITLKNISRGFDPKWYVRGFIISMCEEVKDLENGFSLVKKRLGSYKIPVVPLFENEKGLQDSVKTLKIFFEKNNIVNLHKEKWNSKFEIMIGYSDSSKESGVIYSRSMLENSVKDLDRVISKSGLTPVFFHGSGGSITRGGGSISDQIAWWPKSALEVFKTTIQGESIQRSLSDSSIIESQLSKIINEYINFKSIKSERTPVLDNFLKSVQREYQNLLQDKEFKSLIFESTLYSFLDQLKFGSRPTKRKNPEELSLRAIPWVLCWTQNRLFLPVWWGLGTSWSKLDQTTKSELIKTINKSKLISTFIKQLGFTLEKAEVSIWNYHFFKGSKNIEHYKKWSKIIKNELELTHLFFQEVTSKDDFLWYRPWLKESIKLRSSLIHPLSLIQQRSIEIENSNLLRLSVTGVACGMLTTG